MKSLCRTGRPAVLQNEVQPTERWLWLSAETVTKHRGTLDSPQQDGGQNRGTVFTF